MRSEGAPDDRPYDPAFFARIETGARRSAALVVPMLVETFQPRSVADFGGGAGHWAAACLANGVGDVLTIDGPWVPRPGRVVAADQFLEHDLLTPVKLGRTFDLALCLEAAEHLPADAAEGLVDSLALAAPIVVFSAALPGQGGDGHVNEQPPSYWARLFAACDYACFPSLRQRIWNNEEIEVWYRQNLLCFVRRSEAPRWRRVLGDSVEASDGALDVAHPELLLRHQRRADQLELYARRLEAEAEQGRQALEQTRRALQACQAELRIFTASPLWRGWRLAVRAARHARRRRAP